MDQREDQYDIHREIDHLLAGIEFELRQIDPAQHVRDFLVAIDSPIWRDAAVFTYTVPLGHVHLVVVPVQLGENRMLVFEDAAGNLSRLMATGISDGKILSQVLEAKITDAEYKRERKFMSRVSRCVPEISDLIRYTDGVHHKHKVALINLLLEIERRLRASIEDKLR